jgi:hypothetical protein
MPGMGRILSLISYDPPNATFTIREAEAQKSYTWNVGWHRSLLTHYLIIFRALVTQILLGQIFKLKPYLATFTAVLVRVCSESKRAHAHKHKKAHQLF